MKLTSAQIHLRWMQRAIQLARRAAGNTSPNPMVGAVLVKNGKVIGEGFHKKAGTPHAEIHALKQAGKKAKGSTLYVTLEPCCHFGRTGPCTEALIAAGVRHVFIGSRDPNPLVAGKGIKKLRATGIKVELGIERVSCDELLRGFHSRVTRARPFVLGKIAQSVDGKIALANGESQWITSAESRKYAHQLRLQSDAILVGANTVRSDNPRLTVRIGKKEIFKPVVVLDSKLNLPPRFQLFQRTQGEVILATTNASLLEHRHQWENLGFTVWLLPQGVDGHVDLVALLQKMGEKGWNEILVEGGSTLMTALLRAKLLDALAIGIAPILLGGDGLPALRDLQMTALDAAVRLNNVRTQHFGNDIWIEGSLCSQE